MKITCNIQNNVIAINYAGLGISIDRNEILNSADAIINLLNILPFPAEVKKDMIKDLDQAKQFLPIFRKISESLEYKNDCSCEIVFNEDGTIDLSQTEVQSMIHLPKLLSGLVEFHQLKDKLAEERRAKYEAQEREWEAEQQKREEEYEAERTAREQERIARREEREKELQKLRDRMQPTDLGTDQSMEEMADNKIVFEERPTTVELKDKLNEKLKNTTVFITDVISRARAEGFQITTLQPLTGNLVATICDSYGLDAQLEWEHEHAVNNVTLEGAVNEEETE